MHMMKSGAWSLRLRIWKELTPSRNRPNRETQVVDRALSIQRTPRDACYPPSLQGIVDSIRPIGEYDRAHELQGLPRKLHGTGDGTT